MTTQPRIVGGRYEVGGVLGVGGMAEVHRARDLRLGRDVAVKTLRSDMARDPSFLARFRREALSAASLNHPAIVAVYDSGEDSTVDPPLPYIVMEYVDGRTLRDMLKAERRLEWRQALEITSEVCGALDYSHRQGIVHRDIKPANVMLTPDGKVKVMDFGIARAVTSASATVTQTSTVIGTAQYLSPEQARGEQADARSDIYSTGCLLYELLTGGPPFSGDSPVAIAYQHVREDPVPPSQVNPRVPADADAIVMKALAKSPAVRYQWASEMRTDIQRALAGQPVQALAATTVLAGAEATTVLPDAGVAPVGATQAFAPTQAGYPAGYPGAYGTEPPPKQRSKWPTYLLITLAVLAVFAGAALLTRSLLASGSGSGDHQVPDLSGQTVTQAQATLAQAGLRLGSQTQEFNDADAGTVIGQDPSAGTNVEENDSVDVTVSKGTENITVPNVVGLSLDQATSQLEQNQLSVGTVTQKDSSKDSGTVLSASPSPGSQAEAGGRVNLVVASGNNEVPNVVGQSANSAQSTLNKAGFQVNTTTVPSDRGSPGTVVDQSPNGGSSASVGSSVSISVATEPSPTKSDSPNAQQSAPASETSPLQQPPSPTSTASAVPSPTPNP